MRIVLAQINATVGDIKGNAARVAARAGEARRLGADVVVFPELFISGYPPEDLLLKDHFITSCLRELDEVAPECAGMVALVGVPLQEGSAIYNAAAVVTGGRVAGFYRKILLPNYGVFDEKRYFVPGATAVVLQSEGVRLGVTICEDIWEDDGPGETAAVVGDAEIILNLSMSPYHRGKGSQREAMLAERAIAARAYVCYANGVGGQDELVFDGQSLVFDPFGKLVARACQFDEELLVVDIPATGAEGGRAAGAPGEGHVFPPARSWPVETIDVATDRSACGSEAKPVVGPRICEPLEPEAEVYQALCQGVRDYAGKNGFRHVVMGISGGIDSALTACIAADALGKDKVTAVSMPSRYSSAGTKNDARETAERLGIHYLEIPIEGVFGSYLETLTPHFGEGEPGVTEQNIQARIRGNFLMALSNKFGWLVLTTGNKSEMAVGYATLYGDMAGGFAALKDVPKTLVYRLAEYRDDLEGGQGPIPRTTISRAPSAELAPDQTDQDTLPPYDVLDQIIEAYVVRDESVDEMVAAGLDLEVVRRVVAMIDRNEYKRRQSAPGVRITPKAFGRDRRLPITNRFGG